MSMSLGPGRRLGPYEILRPLDLVIVPEWREELEARRSLSNR
jgi:hypothetical protein